MEAAKLVAACWSSVIPIFGTNQPLLGLPLKRSEAKIGRVDVGGVPKNPDVAALAGECILYCNVSVPPMKRRLGADVRHPRLEP